MSSKSNTKQVKAEKPAKVEKPVEVEEEEVNEEVAENGRPKRTFRRIHYDAKEPFIKGRYIGATPKQSVKKAYRIQNKLTPFEPEKENGIVLIIREATRPKDKDKPGARNKRKPYCYLCWQVSLPNTHRRLVPKGKKESRPNYAGKDMPDYVRKAHNDCKKYPEAPEKKEDRVRGEKYYFAELAKAILESPEFKALEGKKNEKARAQLLDKLAMKEIICKAKIDSEKVDFPEDFDVEAYTKYLKKDKKRKAKVVAGEKKNKTKAGKAKPKATKAKKDDGEAAAPKKQEAKGKNSKIVAEEPSKKQQNKVTKKTKVVKDSEEDEE